MPDVGFGDAPYRGEQRSNKALAEIADHGLADLMRRDAAVRVLVLARRLAMRGCVPDVETAAEALVRGVSENWDPMAITAAEYADSLGVATLDAFLLASRARAAAHAPASVTMTQAKAARIAHHAVDSRAIPRL